MNKIEKGISVSEKDGVKVILTGISFEERARGWTAVHPDAEVENGSDTGITEVTFAIDILDGTGASLRQYKREYAGIDRVLQPGERVNAEVQGFQDRFETAPAGASVFVLGYRSEEELPPVHLPCPGEFLYQALNDELLAGIKENPPVSLTCHTDRGGAGQDAVYTPETGLKEALRAFCAIRIRGKTNVWVTDNYNSITLQWPDGTKRHIQLNLYNLELHVQNREFLYELDGIQNLFLMGSSMDRMEKELARFRQQRSF